MLEIAFRPDTRLASPAYRQLECYLRGLLEAGRLLPGEKLPPTRELAGRLALSRNTVSHAYAVLVDDGMLVSHVGQGTFVAATRPPGGESHSRIGPAPRGFAWDGLLSARARRSLPTGPFTSQRPGVPIRFDFRGGRVDPGVLPRAELRRTWSRVVGERLDEVAEPSPLVGSRALREEIALALVARGIDCEAEDVLVVGGAQQALDLVARVLVDPDDVVVVEQPGYFGAAQAFRASGAQLVGVAVDESGLRTDELAQVLRTRRAKLVYTTPSAQMPTGAVLSEDRRDALLDLADLHHVPIFEDDYDSELRFTGPPLPALKTRDPSGRVIYAGTFSKAVFPGLRVGYLVAARPLLQHLAIACFLGSFGGDRVSQFVVAELLAKGALERHVRRMRRIHSLRREALLDALDAHMPPGVVWTRPAGGHTVWLELPVSVDPDALAMAAGETGIAYTRGEAFSFDGSAHQCLALAFVNQPEEVLRAGAEQLARLIEDELRRRRSR